MTTETAVTKVLVVDNRDSFVFNLTEDLTRLGAHCVVVRGDLSLTQLDEHLARQWPGLVLLSPGPGHPRDAGVMLPFLRREPDIPVLGICLGMQAMVCALGGEVGRAPRPAHGRTSRVEVTEDPLFAGLADGFRAGRYHSLVATALPDSLEPIAWTEEPGDGRPLVMAVRHRARPWIGLQFHPESVLSPRGPHLLANILRELSPCRS